MQQIVYFFAFLSFFAKKCWKWLFRPTFGVCSTQMLVKIYNTWASVFIIIKLMRQFSTLSYLPQWLWFRHTGFLRLDPARGSPTQCRSIPELGRNTPKIESLLCWANLCLNMTFFTRFDILKWFSASLSVFSSHFWHHHYSKFIGKKLKNFCRGFLLN